MIVHALTYCPHPVSAYGNLLVFDSIRKGFPTAQIEVWDNESCPEVREAIQAAASRAGADFHPMRRVHYTDHLRWVLLEREHPKGVPLVLCDPDVAFWDTVQDWDFGDRLMAGRLMPIIRRGGPIALPRLHPSLLFVPDVAALRRAVRQTQALGWDGIGQRTSFIAGQAYFWDTLADLSNALASRCVGFTDAQLDCYDHLFCGTHMGMIGASGGAAALALWRSVHQSAASGDMAALRGVWRRQQAILETEAACLPANPTEALAGTLSLLADLSQWQGQRYTYDELRQAARLVFSGIARAEKGANHETA